MVAFGLLMKNEAHEEDIREGWGGATLSHTHAQDVVVVMKLEGWFLTHCEQPLYRGS